MVGVGGADGKCDRSIYCVLKNVINLAIGYRVIGLFILCQSDLLAPRLDLTATPQLQSP